MRIGLITYDFHPPIGGQGVEVRGLYDALRSKDGFRPIVVSASRNDLEDHLGVPVRAARGGQFAFSAKLAARLEGFVAGHGFDVVQAYGGPGGVSLLRKPAVPLVYVANHTYAQQHRFMGRELYRGLRRLEARGYALADRIVAISNDTAGSLVRDYGVPPGKVEVIPVGVNTSAFAPLDLERIPGSVLYAGRLCERKGLPLLLEAMSILRGRHPGAKLHVIGEGALRAGLEQTARRLGIADRVEFLGKVGEAELAGWYNRAEVFVLPSLFEGFGIVCVEAMACGTPVVAARAPGVTDIIEDGRNGLLVDRDPARLADAVASLLADGGLARALAGEGRRDVLEKFNWAQIADRFADLYRRLVTAGGHARGGPPGEADVAGAGVGEER